MPGFRITSRTMGSMEVSASNWPVALGQGLERLGVVASMDRIACEAHPNGTILVRDVRSGQGFVVQPLDEAIGRPEETDEVFAAPEDTDDGVTAEEKVILPLIAEISRAPSRSIAIQRALDAAVAMVPSESGAVLLTERGGAMGFAGAFGPEAHKLRDVAIPAGSGFAGFCASRLTALSIKDPYADSRFCRAIDDITGYKTHSLLVVPVALDRRGFGCLELVNVIGHAGFDDGAMALLSQVATALAVRLAASGPVEPSMERPKASRVPASSPSPLASMRPKGETPRSSKANDKPE